MCVIVFKRGKKRAPIIRFLVKLVIGGGEKIARHCDYGCVARNENPDSAILELTHDAVTCCSHGGSYGITESRSSHQVI